MCCVVLFSCSLTQAKLRAEQEEKARLDRDRAAEEVRQLAEQKRKQQEEDALRHKVRACALACFAARLTTACVLHAVVS